MAFDQILWDKNACGPRCLIELAKQKQGVTIRDVDLYNKHVGHYVGWATTPGATNTIVQCFLALDLQLANDFETYTDPIRVISEWTKPECIGMLFCTERMPDPNNPQLLLLDRHVMLATKVTNNDFSVWNPTSDGKAHIQNRSWWTWHQWMMWALVLYKS